MKIRVKQFGKSFEAKPSNKNIRKSLELQLKLAESDDIDDDTKLNDQNKLMLQVINMTSDFLKDVLGLSEAQVEKLDDIDYEETIDIAFHVIRRLNGMSEDDIKKADAIDAKKSEESNTAASADLGTEEPA